MKVALVGCAKLKHQRPTCAEELYVSPLFKAARRVARKIGTWYILSAKYGLLRPSEIIPPYDEFLGAMSPRERAVWGAKTRAQIMREIASDRILVLLAGEDYGACVAGLPNKVERPLAGLTLGLRLRRLKEMV